MSQELRKSERIKSKNSERASQFIGESQSSVVVEETPFATELEATASMGDSAVSILAEIRSARGLFVRRQIRILKL